MLHRSKSSDKHKIIEPQLKVELRHGAITVADSAGDTGNPMERQSGRNSINNSCANQ